MNYMLHMDKYEDSEDYYGVGIFGIVGIFVFFIFEA